DPAILAIPYLMEFPSMVRCTREDQHGREIKDWKKANALLSGLNVKGRSFIIFEKEYGDYVQCAGSKKAMTIEARSYNKDGTFRHVVFGFRELDGDEVEIPGNERNHHTDASQVLTLKDARSILQPWLAGYAFPTRFVQTDITSHFL
ncbi:MAG: hypothetical protein ACI97B_000119, partial [Verrucomicrobiales bacterium]